jgi:hypothetical protein
MHPQYASLEPKGDEAMDNDAMVLQNALRVLREQHGAQLDAAGRGMEPELRHTLQQQMGLDEPAADRVVKKLYQTGRLGALDAGEADETSANVTPPTEGAPVTLALPSLQVPAPTATQAAGIALGAAAVDTGAADSVSVEASPAHLGDPGTHVPEDLEGARDRRTSDTDI